MKKKPLKLIMLFACFLLLAAMFLFVYKKEAPGENTDKVAVLHINTDIPLSELKEDRNTKSPASLYVYDAKGRQTGKYSIGIKGHGNMSWSSNEKKSWNLDFPIETSVLGLAKGTRLVALSNAQDQTHLRNAFSFHLAKYMEMEYVPSYVWTEIYINDEYQGLYQLTERIEAGVDRVDVVRASDISKKDKGRITPYVLDNLKAYDYPDNMEPESGRGVLLREESTIRRYEKVDAGFIEEDGFHFGVLYPKMPSRDEIHGIRDYMDALWKAIDSEDGLLEDGRSFTELVDIYSFATKYLVEAISKNHDGNTGSSYYYIKSFQGMNSHLYAGPVWDYDIAYGNTKSNAMYVTPLGVESLRPGIDKHPEFMEIIRGYYASHVSDYLENEAINWLDNEYEIIKEAAKRDALRWKGNPFWNEEDSLEALIKLKEYILTRKDFLDSVYMEGATYFRVNFVDGDKIVHTVYVENGDSIVETIRLQPFPDEYKNFKWYEEDRETEMDPEKILSSSTAYWSENP